MALRRALTYAAWFALLLAPVAMIVRHEAEMAREYGPGRKALQAALEAREQAVAAAERTLGRKIGE